MRPDRGFSCLVQGMGTTVLFDTGSKGGVLLDNLRSLGVNPRLIETVVISHLHSDHYGGLRSLLEAGAGIEVHLPAAVPHRLQDLVKKHDFSVARALRPARIAPGIFSTGALGGSPVEQALVVRTSKGLVVATGCAHPGIVRVVRHAKAMLKEDVLLVLGGFHLYDKGSREIEAVIAALKAIGVRYVAPCHCTGEEALRLFRKGYGSRFIEAGAGTAIAVEALEP